MLLTVDTLRKKSKEADYRNNKTTSPYFIYIRLAMQIVVSTCVDSREVINIKPATYYYEFTGGHALHSLLTRYIFIYTKFCKLKFKERHLHTVYDTWENNLR